MRRAAAHATRRTPTPSRAIPPSITRFIHLHPTSSCRCRNEMHAVCAGFIVFEAVLHVSGQPVARIYPNLRQADVLERHSIRDHLCRLQYTKTRQSQVSLMFSPMQPVQILTLPYYGCVWMSSSRAPLSCPIRLFSSTSECGRLRRPKGQSPQQMSCMQYFTLRLFHYETPWAA